MNATHIEGRRWFQRTYGNTYHSVTVFFEDGTCEDIGPEYGYGTQWAETAVDWLERHGHAAPRERYANGSRLAATRYLDDLGVSYSVIDVPRKRDL